MLLQIQVKREAEAALGKPPRAAMAGRAALGTQLIRRLTRIEIFLRARGGAGEKGDSGERKQAAPWSYWRHQFHPVHMRKTSDR